VYLDSVVNGSQVGRVVDALEGLDELKGVVDEAEVVDA
jgi:hypothetical protein